MDQTELAAWVGRRDVRRDTITAAPVWALHDALDYEREPKPGEAIPPGAHWCFFHDHVPMSKVGPDGYPSRESSFMPEPADLPRRMFAGSRIDFVGDLHIGDTVERTQEIVSVVPKTGKSGRMMFVNVRETFSGPAGVLLVQQKDIVYREAATGAPSAPPQAAPAQATWTRKINPDPVMLFKYGAATLNGHRSHYDRPFATREGYPGLVVHGPLIGILLMDLCRRERPSDRLASFSYRAIAPLFDTAPFTVNGAAMAGGGNQWSLWAANADGHLCMQAEAVFAEAS